MTYPEPEAVCPPHFVPSSRRRPSAPSATGECHRRSRRFRRRVPRRAGGRRFRRGSLFSRLRIAATVRAPTNDVHVRTQPTLSLMVGLPGPGTTTHANDRESRHVALRLTPDEWTVALFGEDLDRLQRDAVRDPVEAVQWQVARRAPGSGCNAVLDWGLWSRAERRCGRSRRGHRRAVEAHRPARRVSRRSVAHHAVGDGTPVDPVRTPNRVTILASSTPRMCRFFPAYRRGCPVPSGGFG